jgi:hypothetical protein
MSLPKLLLCSGLLLLQKSAAYHGPYHLTIRHQVEAMFLPRSLCLPYPRPNLQVQLNLPKQPRLIAQAGSSQNHYNTWTHQTDGRQTGFELCQFHLTKHRQLAQNELGQRLNALILVVRSMFRTWIQMGAHAQTKYLAGSSPPLKILST